MPKIKSPETFSPNMVLTASDLQNHVDGATLLPGVISEQDAIVSVAGDDSLLIHDESLLQLKKVTLNQIFLNPFPIVTDSITGTTGGNFTILSQTGKSISITSGDTLTLSSSGLITLGNNVSVTGTLTVAGRVTVNGTGAMKIPVGTTAERPATPVAGDIRYNSTNEQAEVYSGTEWKAVGGSPFDASGGTVTIIDGYKIHTYTSSGLFTPAANVEGKVEVLVVGGGGGGGSGQFGGGGGGGDVKFAVVTVPKNTPPVSVVVGTGGSAYGGSGTFSMFGIGNITAPGGAGGSGGVGWGGGSGSGIAGGAGSGQGGGGGGGARTGQPAKYDGLAGVGGEGFGSSISGTLRAYGGGGGGGNTNGSVGISTIWRVGGPGLSGGGGGRSYNNGGWEAAPNSGGGGGGGGQGGGPGAGANGIVIVRYRVS
jgi:hypothetical protein